MRDGFVVVNLLLNESFHQDDKHDRIREIMTSEMANFQKGSVTLSLGFHASITLYCPVGTRTVNLGA